MVDAGVLGADAAAGELLDRFATRIPAAPAPAANAPITTHFKGPRIKDVPLLDEAAGVSPVFDSAMYWKETMPARACSFDATMRIENRPGVRFICMV